MDSDPASLERLRDLAEPPSAPWWPPAVGWWILAVLILTVGVWFGLRAWRKWRLDAYRRAALAELARAEHSREVAAILKRTALAVAPRAKVAGLSGEAWCNWLTETWSGPLLAEVSSALRGGLYAEPETELATLRTFAASWIRTHRRPQLRSGS